MHTYIHTHNGILLSHQKEFAATRVDLEIFILSEVSQRRRNILRHPLYVESKKK